MLDWCQLEPDSIDFSEHQDSIASWSFIAREIILQPKRSKYKDVIC